MIDRGGTIAASSPGRAMSLGASPYPVPSLSWAVLVVALGATLRLAMVPQAGIYVPDELFQYLEQAHRLVFRTGVTPWEYRDGIRSWLLPLTVALPMKAGAMLDPGSGLYLSLPRIAAALASLTVVVSAMALGKRQSTAHALLAGTVAATWPELVYLAPHILSESASVTLFLPAAVLATGRPDRRRMAAAGVLLGLSVLLRIQHLPAAALLAGWAMHRRRECWMPFAAGLATALLLSIAVDLVMGQAPLEWMVRYVRENLVEHRAARYGTAPAGAYLTVIAQAWGAWTGSVIVLAAVAARRRPALFAVALIDLVVHMAVAHKEYRFILLTTTLLPILAALGSGDVIEALRARWPRWPRHGLLCAGLVGWLAAAGTIAAGARPTRNAMTEVGGATLFQRLRTDPAACGVATYGLPFAFSGGYTYLHRPMPFFSYAPGEEARMRADAVEPDRIGAARSAPLPPGFAITGCEPGDGALCLAVRPGGCARISSRNEINRLLRRTGE